MELREYLFRENIKNCDFAKKVGTFPLQVTHWKNKKTIPLSRHLKKIIEVTGGKVTPNDFFEEELKKYKFIEENMVK